MEHSWPTRTHHPQLRPSLSVQPGGGVAWVPGGWWCGPTERSLWDHDLFPDRSPFLAVGAVRRAFTCEFALVEKNPNRRRRSSMLGLCEQISSTVEHESRRCSCWLRVSGVDIKPKGACIKEKSEMGIRRGDGNRDRTNGGGVKACPCLSVPPFRRRASCVVLLLCPSRFRCLGRRAMVDHATNPMVDLFGQEDENTISYGLLRSAVEVGLTETVAAIRQCCSKTYRTLPRAHGSAVTLPGVEGIEAPSFLQSQSILCC